MSDDILTRRLRAWQEAETDGSDDDAADEAFAALYASAMTAPEPSAGFAAGVARAVAAARDRDARRVWWLKRASGVAAAAAALTVLFFGSATLFSLLAAAVVGGLNLMVETIVWVAEGGRTPSGVWATLGGLGRAAAAFVAEPRVTVAILGFQVVAAAALVVMHRLLGGDREWIE